MANQLKNVWLHIYRQSPHNSTTFHLINNARSIFSKNRNPESKSSEQLPKNWVAMFFDLSWIRGTATATQKMDLHIYVCEELAGVVVDDAVGGAAAAGAVKLVWTGAAAGE